MQGNWAIFQLNKLHLILSQLNIKKELLNIKKVLFSYASHL